VSRIADCFKKQKARNRCALVPYITAGDPHPDYTVEFMHTLVEAGADLIELGVPFSDPMADGPVIQSAHERALCHRVGLHKTLEMVMEFRRNDQDTPIVLMGYLNPVERMGYASFAAAAREAGIDGVLTVDQPPEEGKELFHLLEEEALDPIFLLAPTTKPARLDRICAHARGYVYYVSLKGVTGADTLDIHDVAERMGLIREHCKLPVGVGFGIKDADTAAKMARVADAVIVGSALVKLIEKNVDEPQQIAPALRARLTAMRSAMDEARATESKMEGMIR